MSRRGAAPQITKKHLARAERERIQRRWIASGTILTAVLLIGILAYGWADLNYLQPRKPIVVVGSERITIRQFQGRVKLAQADLVSQYQQYQQIASLLGGDLNTQTSLQQQLGQIEQQLANPVLLGQSIMESMVNDVFIRNEARTRGITVTEGEIDEVIEQGFGYFPNGTPTFEPTPTVDPTQQAAPTSTATPGSSPTPTASATPGNSPTPTLSPSPRPTATTFTQQAFETAVKDYMVNLKDTLGAEESDLRARVEASLYRQRIQEAFAKETPDEQEQVLASHILVADEDTAKQVLARLDAGDDWEALAGEYSTDTSNKDKGGDLGWFPRGQMVSEFETAAFDAPVGEIVGPVLSSFGWHLIKVEGHEVRAVDAAILSQQRQAAFGDWLTAQRDQTEVVITSGWEAFVPTVAGLATPVPSP